MVIAYSGNVIKFLILELRVLGGAFIIYCLVFW